MGWLAVVTMGQNVTSITSGMTYLIKCGGTDHGTTAPFLYDDNGTIKCQPYSYGDDKLQQWVVTAVDGKDGYYTVRNVSTGKYMVPLANQSDVAQTSSVETEVCLKKAEKNAGVSSLTWFLILNSADATFGYNQYDVNKVSGWGAEPGKMSCSDWGVIPVDYYIGVAEAAQTAAGEAKPIVGNDYYTIHSALKDGTIQKIAESNGKASLIADDNTSDYSQYWKLVDAGDGKVAFQNVLTGHYIQHNGAHNAPYTTGTEAYGFTVNANSQVLDQYRYDIIDTGQTYGFNSTDKGLLYSWEPYNGSNNSNSLWWFKKVTVDEATGEAVPEVGNNVYTIHSTLPNGTKLKLSESWGTATLVDESSTSDYNQYWKLVDAGNGKTAFLNVHTGHYIQHNGTKGKFYSLGSDPYGFTISSNRLYTSAVRYDVKDTDTDTEGFNSTDQGKLCRWTLYDGTNDPNSLWSFKKVALDEQLAMEQNKYAQDERLKQVLKKGVVRIQTAMKTNYGNYAGGYVTDIWEEGATGTTCHMRAEKASTAADYYRQVWVLEPSGNGYKFRNLYTGRYLNKQSTSTAPVTLYVRYNQYSVDCDDDKVSLSTESDFSGHNCLHYQVSEDKVVGWEENAGASNWYFDTVDISVDEVRIQFDRVNHHISDLSDAVSTNTTNKWVYIRNLNGNYMTEDVNQKNGQVTARINGNYAQIWQLTSVDGKEGYYQLKNALTEDYLQFTSFNDVHTLAAAEAEGGYQVNRISSYFPYDTYFEFHPTTLQNRAVHRSGERLLTWNSYNGGSDTEGSVWWFEDAGVTDAEVEAARSTFAANNAEKANADAYNTALEKYFTDASCTALKESYCTLSDEALKSAMNADGITSDALQQMAVKVKNNGWEKWEKTFRVQQVQPFSDPWKWNNDLKVGYVYTNLSNPTGIYLSQFGELAYVFVGDDIPENCSMAAIMVPKTDSQGTEVTLKKGLNIIPNTQETVALFIRYTVPTSLADAKMKIADFQKMPVHIEGGTVNGYFDLTRQDEGIGTDEAWKEMLSDGLIMKYPFCQMKGERTIFNMNSKLVKQYVPEQMSEIIGFWDWVLQVEHETAGLDAYRDRWNNYMGNYSVTYGYMFATSYGTYYNEETLGTILTYDDGNGGGMKYSGGALWGPAHEMGHIHQSLFNMIGCTEISNNVFSNAVLFRNGRTTTRTAGVASISSIANKLADGTCWHDYNIWERTRMYFQLYLYYHVQGHKKDFFPRLFDAFRSDPIIRKHSDNSAVPATEDYLHFALKCCEVSGDDLSEFFQAYGMFVPFEKRTIDDYGNFPTYATQEEIDAAIAKMHTYAKPKGNILFIEDHIRLEQAIDHDGNPLVDDEGNAILRKDYEDNCAVGKMGDVGQYTDYVDGNYADGYTCTISDEGVVTMSGTGAVGYKVYDQAGNLLYFSNSNTFTLPQTVQDKLGDSAPVIKAAQANGTDVTLPTGEVKYEVKVYRTNSTAADKAQTVYTDLTEATLPQLEDNDLAYVSGTNAVEALTSLTNYVNADDNTATHIVLTDLKDFYAPAAFTTQSLTYTRRLYEGYNSVCLPFDFEAADFGEGAAVECLSGTTDQNGTTWLNFTSATGKQAAGTPCLVKCAADADAHEIRKTNVHVTSTPLSQLAGNTVTMEGSFLNQPIGAGKYKLNDSGTKFGITTDKGMVGAFRSYIAPAAGILQMPLSFGVNHITAPSTGIQNASDVPSESAPACFDLSGRRVSHPVQKGVYIINGKKIIK